LFSLFRPAAGTALEFAVAPRIVARDNLRCLAQHVGTGMYLLQWLSAGVVFARLQRRGAGRLSPGCVF
jgi:hypothetical protein